jgi:hypothetical protein
VAITAKYSMDYYGSGGGNENENEEEKKNYFAEEATQSVVKPFFVGEAADIYAHLDPLSKEFMDLVERQELPDGRAARYGKGPIAYETVWSVDKSIDVGLRASFGEKVRHDVERTIFEAMGEAATFQMHLSSEAKIGKDGTRRVHIQTCAVIYQNYHSRSDDPNTHGHVVFLAHGIDPLTGKVHKKDFTLDYGIQDVTAAYFQKRLDEKLQEKGFKTFEKNGRVAVAAPEEVCRKFSRRAEEINRKVPPGMAHSKRARRIVAQATAGKRNSPPPTINEQMCRVWCALIERGFDFTRLLKGKERQPNAFEKMAAAERAIDGAKRKLNKERGAFTWDELAKTTYTLAIGTPARTIDLTKRLEEIRRLPRENGLAKVLGDRFTLKGKAKHYHRRQKEEQAKATKATKTEKERQQKETPRPSFSDRVKDFASRVTEKVKEWRAERKARREDRITIDASWGQSVEKFRRDVEPLTRKRAHRRAVRAIRSQEFRSVDDALIAAESAYKQARVPQRSLDRDTSVRIINAEYAHPDDLRRIRKACEKAKANFDVEFSARSKEQTREREETRYERERRR